MFDPKRKESAIEFAHPLLTIFKKFVGNLMEKEKDIFIRTRASNLCFAADFLQGEHSHHFTVKFSRHGPKEYTVNCHQPCTVLEAIKSTEKYKEKVKCADANIIIQLGKEDKESIVPTHFPCSCISDDECLIISCKKETIEEAQDQQNKIIYPRDRYIVFFIDTKGGVNTETKKLFRSSAVKKYKNVCVYGEKGMTVEAALKRDGRFSDDLSKFELSDNENPNILTDCTVTVDNLDHKTLKIRLPRSKSKSDEKQQEKEGASNNLQNEHETRSVEDVVKQSGVSVKRAVEKSGSDNTDEIYEILCQQFPDLKKWMEERFSGNSYQEELTLRKEDFGKIQQFYNYGSFSEVYRISNLLKLGESVCEVIVEDVGQGTGFVLFDNFILTNAHLFKHHVDEAKLQVDVDVWIRFNYDEPDPYLLNLNLFSCKKTFIDFDAVQDYAILENFGPVPLNGKAYIIGHPAGGVKKMDVTHIIEEEDRVQAVNDHLQKVVTYKTFMYRGSSGSPVFDAFGRVFGLHSLIFAYKFGDQPHIVMGCAYPLHIMFKQFVIKLKESGNYELLSRVEEEAKGNKFLEMISPPTPYSEYFRVRRPSSDYTSKVCEDSEGKEDC
uniref:Serine protease n=1 Tax=Seriola lalandi dorsalis TaxID=1841481 RepID=A0A3B4Y262_SERLL